MRPGVASEAGTCAAEGQTGAAGQSLPARHRRPNMSSRSIARAVAHAALLPLAACGNSFTQDDSPGIPGTGSGNQRSFQAAGFDSVELAGSDDVSVRVGGGFAVTAEGDAEALDKLKITRDGNTLRVSRRNGRSRGHARVTVTMPAITGAILAGSGNLSVDRVEALSAKPEPSPVTSLRRAMDPFLQGSPAGASPLSQPNDPLPDPSTPSSQNTPRAASPGGAPSTNTAWPRRR